LPQPSRPEIGVGQHEIELADIRGDESRPHHVGPVDGARLEQELLELIHVAHRLLAEGGIELELLLDHRAGLALLQLKYVAREYAAFAAMEAFPDRVRHRLLQDARKIDR
jgi:hypothetical protein